MPAAKKKGKTDEEEGPTVGVYMFPNGDKYDGEYAVNSDGTLERSGKGTHTTADGVIYCGNWSGDKMNGQGTMQFPSGCTYEGEFVNNTFEGHGTYTWPNKSFYKGEFAGNKMQGSGKFTDTDGQVWNGNFMYKAAPGLRFQVNLDI